jgi:hypothetical protein
MTCALCAREHPPEGRRWFCHGCRREVCFWDLWIRKGGEHRVGEDWCGPIRRMSFTDFLPKEEVA